MCRACVQAGRTNQYDKPYEAVLVPGESWRNRRIEQLPRDPVAAATVS